MNKPIIYYQFDEDKYRALHYQKGFFDYKKDGFGPVIREEKDLVEYIINFNLEFKNPKQYSQKIGSFFKYFDSNNTKRNFNEIEKL